MVTTVDRQEFTLDVLGSEDFTFVLVPKGLIDLPAARTIIETVDSLQFGGARVTFRFDDVTGATVDALRLLETRLVDPGLVLERSTSG